MCIFCGGQCGGMGEFLISLGLPFLVLFFYKIKNVLGRIKAAILPRGIFTEAKADEADKCTCCGETLDKCKSLSVQPIASETMAPLELPSQVKRGPMGVKGWLLFLCLNLTIIIPFSFLYQANIALRIFCLDNNQIQLIIFRQALFYNIVVIAMMILLSIFSFYAGLSLWNIKVKAVKITKIFLITQLFLMTFINIMRPFMSFSLNGSGNSFGDIIKSLIPFLSHFTVWFLYLIFSKRVRNTYSGWASLSATPRSQVTGYPAETIEASLLPPR